MPEEDLGKLKISKPAKSAPPKRRRVKWLFWALVIAVAMAVPILYFTGVIAPAEPVTVTTVSSIYPAQSLSMLNASGYVVAQRRASVSSKATGRLEALLVEEGSRIKKGQIVARLDNQDVLAARSQAQANVYNARAMIEQAKAERDDARRAYERAKELFGKGYIAKADYDAAEARLLRAEAAVRAAEATLKAGQAALQGAQTAVEYTIIKAPFDAVVLTKNADVGDIVTPIGAAANAKSAVVTIADLDSLQVEVDVSETGITSIRKGQPCTIQLDALPDRPFRGEVYAVVPTVDRSKATVMVKVRFIDTDSRILPDMSAKVSFLSRPIGPDDLKPRVAVNQDALVQSGNQSYAWRVDKDTAHKTIVRTGEKIGEMVAVSSGLKEGDKVILNPAAGLRDSVRIKIKER